jgi:lycopene cyclase domain-containing protein
MTYLDFLVLFLGIPLAILSSLAFYDYRRGKTRPPVLQGWPAWKAVLLHVIIAVLYTTPWDNYLVATRVWWYDPVLVLGITLGWVPIEEYTFFVVQTILAGLWLFLLMRYIKVTLPQPPLRGGLRWMASSLIGVFWLGSTVLLLSGWKPGTYLALALSWALPPIGLQLAFGADILWRYRRHLFLAIASLTLYLSLADTLAISAHTWTINPSQSLGMLLGGILPLEEVMFFLLTNILVVFGITLIVAQESHSRIRRSRFLQSFRRTGARYMSTTAS